MGEKLGMTNGQHYACCSSLQDCESTFPADCFAGLEDALRNHVSVSAALNAAGIPSYSRISTRISAEAASQTVARHLHCRTGTPLLRTVAINVDPSGRPLEYGRSYFRGDRIQLVVDAASFPADTPTEEQT
jgi:GntR family phosphonate transport system transcriptional regulator